MTAHSHDKENCIGLAERISEYLDGELPEDLRREVATHVEDCADCVRFIESLRRVKMLGSLLPPQQLPPPRLQPRLHLRGHGLLLVQRSRG